MQSTPPPVELPDSDSAIEWVKSSFCSSGSCIEVAKLPDGTIAIKDSKRSDGPVLVYSQAEWTAFAAGMRSGDFSRFD